MLIDCDDCDVRGLACDDCVITALLGTSDCVEIDDGERQALQVLADGGVVPPLRLVERHPGTSGTDERSGGWRSGAA